MPFRIRNRDAATYTLEKSFFEGFEILLQYVSPAAAAWLGHTAEELLESPALFAAAMPPADWYWLLDQATHAAPEGAEFVIEHALLHKDGTRRRRFRNHVCLEPGGEILSGVLSALDQPAQPAATRCRLTEMVEGSRTPVVVLDLEGGIACINRTALTMAGYAQEEVIGRPYAEIFVPAEQREQAKAVYREIVRVGGTTTSERTVVSREGRQHRFLWTFSPIPNAQGGNDFYLVSGLDLSELQEARDQIHFLNNYDPLTGLPNRLLIQDLARQGMRRLQRSGRVMGLALFRFAQLPRLAATLGAADHDRLTREIGERLQHLTAPGDSCGRDSDGAYILLLERASAEQLRVDLSAILTQVQLPFEHAGNPLFLTAHAGAAVYPADAREPEQLFAAAEVGRQQAQDEALMYPVFYTAEFNQRSRDRLRYENALRGALEQNAFRLNYQPLVELRSGRIVGVEALLRWQHPELGEVPPDVFIPIAEEAGLMAPIGDWVLLEACRQRRRWLDEGLDDLFVSVNLSGRQFVDAELPARVEAALRETGIKPQYLELELTESASMDQPERSIPIMRQLRALGTRLAIDDFGSGYSNLSYLKSFPVNKLKIDKAFIRDICDSPSDLSLVRAIIDMARSLHLDVVAEGVETEAQLALLRSTGCDQIQGYYFSRPLPVEPLTALLRQNRMQPLRTAPTADGTRTLLVLDDEPNITASLRRMLRHKGYAIHVANTVAQAFDILARHEVAVIVSDQRMPDLSGTEFFSRVKTMYPHSVRIILSGYTDLRTITEAINQGAIYKFITKPWEPELLELTLSEAFLHYEKGKAERRLQQSELRYRALMDHNLEAICVFDPHGRLIEANAAMDRVTPFGLQELSGRAYLEVVLPEDRSQLEGIIARAMIEGGPQRVQFRFYKADRSVGHADTVVVPFFDGDEVKGSLAITRDMTAIREAQAALHRRENELDVLFSQDLSGAFFMMLDEPMRWDEDCDKEALLDYVVDHQRVTRVNQAMLEQYGTTESEMLGLTLRELFAHDLPYGRELWRRMFDMGRLHTETDERRLDGAPIRVEGDYICLYDEQGRVTGHFGVQRVVEAQAPAREPRFG